jgi:hypothetical protein
MTDVYRDGPPAPGAPVLDSSRLWAGRPATALVAALEAIAVRAHEGRMLRPERR